MTVTVLLLMGIILLSYFIGLETARTVNKREARGFGTRKRAQAIAKMLEIDHDTKTEVVRG